MLKIESATGHVLLPSDKAYSPEKLLLIALLQRAMLDYYRSRNVNDELRSLYKAYYAAQKAYFGKRKGIPTPYHLIVMRDQITALEKARTYEQREMSKVEIELKQWFRIQAAPFKPWSFCWVCEHLDIKPKLVLKKLKSSSREELFGEWSNLKKED